MSSIQDILMGITRTLGRHESELGEHRRLIVNDPLNSGKGKVLTIVSGSIVATRPNIVLLPETGTSDSLSTITNFSDGKIIILAISDPTHTITVSDQAISGGNIDLRGEDVVLDDPNQSLMLYYSGVTSKWHIVVGQQGEPGDASDIVAEIDAAVEQTVLEDTNAFPLTDEGVLKWASWATIKAALTALFDTLYAAIGHNHDGVYSLIDHDHDGVYSLVTHDHAGVYVGLFGDEEIKGTKTFNAPTSSTLTVEAEDGIANVRLVAYRESVASHARFLGSVARGTKTSPAPIQSGDEMFALGVSGYHSGGAFSGSHSLIRLVAAENFASGAQGMDIDLYTVGIGAAIPTKRASITAAGLVAFLYDVTVAGKTTLSGIVGVGSTPTDSNINLTVFGPTFALQAWRLTTVNSNYRDWAMNIGGNTVGGFDFMVGDSQGDAPYGTGKNVLTMTKERNVLIGTNATPRSLGASKLYVEQAASSLWLAQFWHNSDDAVGARIVLGKSRGVVNASNTIVQIGDVLGSIEFWGADGSGALSPSIGASIWAEVSGTPSNSDMPTDLVLATTPDGSNSPIGRVRITQAGLVAFLYDVTMAGNLTIQDGKFVYLRNPAVDHGMTTLFPTDVYGLVATSSLTVGGLAFYGLTDGNTQPILFSGYIGTTTPTVPVIVFRANKKNGTGSQVLADAEILLTVENGTTRRFAVMGNGDLLTDGWRKVNLSGIVGTVITIIPDGAGDITRGIVIRGVASNTTPGVAEVNSGLLTPSTLYDLVIGADTLRFSVNAGGALFVVRQAGSATWTISVTLTWI